MFHNRTVRVAALLALLSTTAIPQTGFAASYLDTVKRGTKTTYTPTLAELTRAETNITTRTLDWQQPSIALYFDLPPAERTSEIVLTLSADPLTYVAKNAPLEVQFNNSKPVPVLSNGRGFEARIPFDAARARDRRNLIRITYPIPAGAECIAPAHGAWSIDLSASTLKMSGRMQSRQMSLTEISDYLSQPALSPKKVGLLARGPNGPDMQALAAQAISLRTPGVPKFSVTSNGNDFNLVMVRRDRLFEYTDDPMLLDSSGARIFVPRGRPTQLIFTADTDAEIVQMLKVFAARKLPNTRRPISSLGELNLQSRLDSGSIKVEGKTHLADLAVASNAGPGSQSYKFGVLDPTASSGEILLRLSSSKKMSDTSRLRVALNGKVLGATKLDKKRKSVAFQVTPGTLNATSNIINIIPDLDSPKGYNCPSLRAEGPNFSIGDGSRLILSSNSPSPVTELASLASTGGLFAKSESYIALPKNTGDYQASLRILGRLAKSAGHGLTLADYSRGPDVPSDKHRLIIGPSNMALGHLSRAPKALRDALSGRPSSGENLLKANFESYASAGHAKYAANQTKARRVARGGLAALYGSGDGNLTGIISAAPGDSFIRASDNLVKLDHWNALQGGVSRWTSSSVLMAQTAQSDSGIRVPVIAKGFNLPEFGFSSVELPSFDWPELSWPEVEMPKVSLPKFEWPSFKTSEPSQNTQISDIQPLIENQGSKPVLRSETIKLAEVTPRLKPVSTPQIIKEKTIAAAGLRGPFKFQTHKDDGFGSWKSIRRSTKRQWTKTKIWAKSKTNGLRNIQTLEDVARATDRLQDNVQPAGRSMKSSLKDKFPGKGLVRLGDRTVSVYGLMLIMSFILVLLLMSLAKPSSRLGGRH